MAMDSAFDLLTEPWIPCIDDRGQPHERGVLDVFARAHELSRIVDHSPLVTYALHRFLVAVLMSCVRIGDEDELAELWQAGRFDADIVDKVSRSCADRMRLFDEKHPFYQSGDIALRGKPSESTKTVGYLMPEESTGTNVVHFSHTPEDGQGYCPVCCAKGLLMVPAFATSGGAGIKPSINGVPPLYVMPVGSNVFGTLMLNYVLPGYHPPIADADDPGSAWVSDGTVAAKDVRVKAGFVESLSWQARRTRLFPGLGGRCSKCGRQSSVLVRKMVFSQGRSRDRDLPVWVDPWASYQLKKGQDGSEKLVPVRPSEERDVWRDFPRLFFSSEDAGASRPSLLNQVDNLAYEGLVPDGQSMTFEAFGLRTDMKAKIFEWRHDVFQFPAGVLHDSRTADTIRRAFADTDDAAYAMRLGLKQLHPITERKNPDRNAVAAAAKSLAVQAQRSYWQSLEPVFRTFICDPRLLGSLAGMAGWLAEWREAVRDAATQAFETAVEGFDRNADALRRQQRARAVFFGRLKRLEGGNQS